MMARTIYLRAATPAAMAAALLSAGVAHKLDAGLGDGEQLQASEGVTLQILGRLAGPADAEGNAALLPGWHAMLLDVGTTEAQRVALAALTVDAAAYPVPLPVFAGVEPPPPPAPLTAAGLREAATACRWACETGGLQLPGSMHIDTGRNDQNAITRIIANAEEAGIETVNFKAANGWTTMTLPQVREIACAVARHVQACYDRERALHEAIDAAGDDPDALAAIDVAAGWPDGGGDA